MWYCRGYLHSERLNFQTAEYDAHIKNWVVCTKTQRPQTTIRNKKKKLKYRFMTSCCKTSSFLRTNRVTHGDDVTLRRLPLHQCWWQINVTYKIRVFPLKRCYWQLHNTVTWKIYSAFDPHIQWICNVCVLISSFHLE